MAERNRNTVSQVKARIKRLQKAIAKEERLQSLLDRESFLVSKYRSLLDVKANPSALIDNNDNEPSFW